MFASGAAPDSLKQRARSEPVSYTHLDVYKRQPQQSRMYGFPEVRAFTPDRWLEQGDKVSFGNVEMDVLHCPGHTPGHVVLFNEPGRLAIVGDVLFQGSIGRTDFPKGDFDTLISSIRGRLWPLGNDVAFIPGHGPMSTFGAERRSNPYCCLLYTSRCV